MTPVVIIISWWDNKYIIKARLFFDSESQGPGSDGRTRWDFKKFTHPELQPNQPGQRLKD